MYIDEAHTALDIIRFAAFFLGSMLPQHILCVCLFRMFVLSQLSKVGGCDLVCDCSHKYKLSQGVLVGGRQLELRRASISGGWNRRLQRWQQPAVALPLPYPKQEVKISHR